MQAGIIDMQPNVRRNRGCGAAELMSHEHEWVANNVLLAPLRGGACFCTRDALQGYDC